MNKFDILNRFSGDRRICEMDGRSALMFWRKNKDALLAMAKADGRGASAAKTTEAA